MKIPESFVLAALFSQIGRLQKRAEGTPGLVKDCSQRWLEEKIPRAAQTLATWETLIDKAALLALGLETPLTEADQQRFTVDAGDVSVPLTSLFSKVPASDGGVQVRSLPFFSSQEYVYPLDAAKVSTSEYKRLWDTLNQLVTKAGSEFSPEVALTLLEHCTTHVPCLLPVEGDQHADRFSDISLFDVLKIETAIASCLYAYAMAGVDGGEEEAVSFEPKESSQPYLLVGGDFSGVQEFIYRISSKGALKAVRGRSFFLELLTQHVVAELLDATSCSRANVLYAAGATFSLLLPNLQDVRTVVARVRKEINTYLIQVHAGKLALILECQACGDSHLQGREKDGWWKLRAEIGSKIGGSKNRKFAAFLQDDDSQGLPQEETKCHSCGRSTGPVQDEELARWGLIGPLCRFCFLLVAKNTGEHPEQKPSIALQPQSRCLWCKAKNSTPTLLWVGEEIATGCTHELCLGKMESGECQVCHRQTLLSPLPTPEIQTAIETEASEKPESIWACPFCRNLYHLGEHLPDLRYVCRSDKPPSVQPRMIVNIGSWFYVFPKSIANLERSLPSDAKTKSWIVNGDDIGHSVPHKPWSPLVLGNYHPEPTDEERHRLGMSKNQKALDFSNFAQASIGSPLIGALRMDIDNLGDLFTRKIPKEAMIPVRTSALSRLLSRFFTSFINTLCEGRGLPSDQTTPFWLFSEGRLDQSSKKRWVTVVYSGGDDLFIVGAWSEVIELAFDIHTAFRRYVCNHPDITLSGGMIVQHEDFPLYQIANLAHDAEEKAKENTQIVKTPEGSRYLTKDSFSPLYTHGQNALFWDEAEKVRALATDIVTYLKDSQTPADQQLRLKVPRALLTQLFETVEIYRQEGKLYLPRLAYILAHDEIPKDLKHKLLHPHTIRYLHPVLVWLDLLSRGGGDDSHARS